MKEDSLDTLLDNYLAELANNPSDEWIATNAQDLFSEGIGIEGLLNTIAEEHGQEIQERVKAALDKSAKDSSHDPDTISGIGGWLLFFCFVLVLFTPARNIISAYKLYESTSPFFAEYTGIMQLTYISLLLIAVIISFSVYCGILLWQLKPHAVRVTKIYLVVFLLSNLIQPALLYLYNLPQEFIDASLQSWPKEMVQPVIFFLFWYGYLSLSRRVSVTYQQKQ